VIDEERDRKPIECSRYDSDGRREIELAHWQETSYHWGKLQGWQCSSAKQAPHLLDLGLADGTEFSEIRVFE
jgi:hypothetical protein